MLATVALAGAATVDDQPARAQTTPHPCHLLTSAQSVPEGFGAAYNVFSAAKELLLNVTCDASSSNAVLNVGNGQNTTYIYRVGYEWTGSQWKQIAFGGKSLAGNDWYVGSAYANISRSETQLEQDNFVVAYTCLWQNKAWKCGCRDTSCTTNYWQLQVFRQTASGEEGIAAQYPEDWGIANHPSVVFHDNFESGSLDKWDSTFNVQYTFASASSHVHAGNRSLEIIIPKGSSGGNIGKRFRDHDRIYLRWYQKWGAGWDTGPRKGNHAGALVAGCSSVCMPGNAGVRADGTNKFGTIVHPSEKDGDVIVASAPGKIQTYTYHMDQPGTFGDDQYVQPDFVPKLETWYAFEVMIKVNTIGKGDGELNLWIDGKLVYERNAMRFRSEASLALDKIGLMGYIHENSVRTNRVYFDDIVAATEYIGPMAP